MKNRRIREAAKTQGVMLWEIAERLGVTDSTFSRKLRRELPDGEQERLISIISDISHTRIEQEA